MSPLVSFQLEHLSKRLAAKIALKGPLIRMDRSYMVVQMISGFKFSITVSAKETLTNISTCKMIPNITFVCKFSLTNCALVALLSVKVHNLFNVGHVLKIVPSLSYPHHLVIDGQSRVDLFQELLTGLHSPDDHILRVGGGRLVWVTETILVLVKIKLATGTMNFEPLPHVLRPLARDEEGSLVAAGGHACLFLVRVVLEADVLQLLLQVIVLLRVHGCPGAAHGGNDHRTPVTDRRHTPVDTDEQRLFKLGDSPDPGGVMALAALAVLHQQTLPALDVAARVHNKPVRGGAGHLAAAWTRPGHHASASCHHDVRGMSSLLSGSGDLHWDHWDARIFEVIALVS